MDLPCCAQKRLPPPAVDREATRQNFRLQPCMARFQSRAHRWSPLGAVGLSSPQVLLRPRTHRSRNRSTFFYSRTAPRARSSSKGQVVAGAITTKAGPRTTAMATPKSAASVHNQVASAQNSTLLDDPPTSKIGGLVGGLFAVLALSLAMLAWRRHAQHRRTQCHASKRRCKQDGSEGGRGLAPKPAYEQSCAEDQQRQEHTGKDTSHGWIAQQQTSTTHTHTIQQARNTSNSGSCAVETRFGGNYNKFDAQNVAVGQDTQVDAHGDTKDDSSAAIVESQEEPAVVGTNALPSTCTLLAPSTGAKCRSDVTSALSTCSDLEGTASTELLGVPQPARTGAVLFGFNGGDGSNTTRCTSQPGGQAQRQPSLSSSYSAAQAVPSFKQGHGIGGSADAQQRAHARARAATPTPNKTGAHLLTLAAMLRDSDQHDPAAPNAVATKDTALCKRTNSHARAAEECIERERAGASPNTIDSRCHAGEYLEVDASVDAVSPLAVDAAVDVALAVCSNHGVPNDRQDQQQDVQSIAGPCPDSQLQQHAKLGHRPVQWAHVARHTLVFTRGSENGDYDSDDYDI